MSKVLVRWNKTNVMSVSTGLPDASVVQFIPGANEFTGEQWKLISEHPEIKKRMETEVIDLKRGKVKMIEVLSERKAETKQDDNGDEDESGISGLGVKAAKTLVAETFNTVLLRSWAESETRKGVTDAINKQLEAIDAERAGDDSQE